jgi:hypothetical protein
MHNIVDHGYDGNGFWLEAVAFLIFLMGYVVYRYKRQDQLNPAISIEQLIAGLLFLSGGIAVAIFQVATHR